MAYTLFSGLPNSHMKPTPNSAPRPSLWIPSVRVPTELMPVGFRSYQFDARPVGRHSLSLPSGGITFSGDLFVQSFHVLPSEELPPPLSVIVTKGRKGAARRHLVQSGTLAATADKSGRATPICGQTLKSWEHSPRLERSITVCAKTGQVSDRDSLAWCTQCIKSLRHILGGRRVTHATLSPLPNAISAETALPEDEQAMMAFILEDNKSHTDRSYGYCDQCRQPWHEERDDSGVTDWFGRVAGRIGEA